MHLFVTAKHLHCSDVIAFPRNISYGAVIHTNFVCTSIKQLQQFLLNLLILN